MKILFTADWHIKLGQKNVPVSWAKNRYKLLINSLCNIIEQEKPIYLIIGGDIFDKLPSLEELEIYFNLLASLNKLTYKCKVVIYSGNHEALKKNTTFFSSLKEVTTSLYDYADIIDDYYSLSGIDFIPYNKLKQWAENPDNEFFSLHSNILCTHVRGEIPPHVKPEIPLELFDRWKMVLAGDLHSHSNSQRNILYPGSPITTSFHRNNVESGVLIVDTTTLDFRWAKLQLPQLIRKTIKAGEPMPQTDYDHTVYEVEGDMSELSGVENHELLDKKIVKRDMDTSLILEPTMTIHQEVEEYLRYILNINETSVLEILQELNAHEIHE